MLEIIILVFVVLANVLLGMLVYLKNPKSATNRRVLLLTIAICIWSATNYLSVHASADTQLMTVRLVLFWAAFLNLSAFATFRAFPYARPMKDKFLLPAIFGTGFVMILTLTPLVFSHLQNTSSGPSAVPGPGIAAFLLQTILLLFGTGATLLNRYRASKNLERQQFKYVIFGVVMTFGLIFLTNFVFVAFFKINWLLPFGATFTLFFTASLAYAIVKQRLFDIRLVLTRALAYILLLTIFVAVYITVAFGIVGAFFGKSNVTQLHATANTILTLVLALSFQPVRSFFQRGTDRIFYRDSYDSEVILNKFTQVLVSELDLARIMKRSITEICEDLHLEFGQLIIFNNDRVYRIEHFGRLPKRLMIAPELKILNKPMLVADELNDGQRKQVMEDHGIRVSLVLRTREEFIGYLLIGDKLSGDVYSSQDIELLEIIGKELAVGILNAKAYVQIQEFNVTLQARIDHATNRLRVANRHLKELDRAKDEFISMASHQLRTPLTTIKGYLSMMQEGDAGKLTKAQSEFVGYAFGSSERMVNLISDLLNVSRLSAGRFLIQTKPTDMVNMIRDEVRQLETHATAKGIKLIFEPPAEPLPPAEIDDNKTRQVVMNFIDNAIYYTPKGEVRVVLEQSGNCVRLEVRDSGIGVPDIAKKKLFTKFFRADNAQVTRPDGTGLGLYLAKRVVEDQGGTIIFNSVEGKGSTFGFELPFKPINPIREVKHASRKS
jgi:signal transduction histidine kinase